MSILIGADIVPTQSNFDLFVRGDAKELVGKEILEIINKTDHRIFNLEVPLTDIETPIPKCGPNLRAPYNTVKGLKSLGVDLLTLANNHILDQGTQGLDATRKALDEAGIAYLGAGDTPEEAAKPYIFESAGKKVGVYACAEHEFSIVRGAQPGANPYDPMSSFAHIEKLKTTCDYVIVLYHGGKEHYRYPSPDLQKTFRQFADRGADLVVAQHTHCIGCMEEYHGAVLVYGQGNFLFDGNDSSVNAKYWQTGLLLRLDDDFAVTCIPVVRKDNTVRLALGEQRESILEQFDTRSAAIQQPDIVKELYDDFAQLMLGDYLYAISSKGTITRILNRLTGGRYSRWYIRRRYSEKHLLMLQNYIECEAHRELFLAGLRECLAGFPR